MVRLLRLVFCSSGVSSTTTDIHHVRISLLPSLKKKKQSIFVTNATKKERGGDSPCGCLASLVMVTSSSGSIADSPALELPAEPPEDLTERTLPGVKVSSVDW